LCSISFFIQAEDVIRDATVTGVQTCALPIYAGCQDLRDWRRNERDSAHRDRAAAAWQSHRLTQVRVCPSFTSMHWSLASLSRLSDRKERRVGRVARVGFGREQASGRIDDETG